MTIDGEDSKDFDDAVWANYEKEKTKIMVAISDVSHFVSENDPLDLEAKKEGTLSIFLTELYLCFHLRSRMIFVHWFLKRKECVL